MKSLARLLSTVVLGGGAAACSSPSDSCPHTVIDRTATVDIAPSDACDLATGATPPSCQVLCKDTTITYCQLPASYENQTYSLDGGPRSCPVLGAGATVALTCEVTHVEGTLVAGCPRTGRKTHGYVPTPHAEGEPTTGHYFARCAELEALSVIAFHRLARELRALGAPRAFADRAEAAAVEEVRHARTMTKLAARFGATTPALRIGDLPLRPLFEVALENAVEGVVGETFGAAMALHQSVHAEDPGVRAAHAVIAEEERTHAELAFDLDAWFATQLDDEQRARIEAAKAAALDALRGELATTAPPSLRAGAGLPTAPRALAIVDGLFGALGYPLAA